MFTNSYTRSFETLVGHLFCDSVQLGLGLVDLVVCAASQPFPPKHSSSREAGHADRFHADRAADCARNYSAPTNHALVTVRVCAMDPSGPALTVHIAKDRLMGLVESRLMRTAKPL